MLSRMKFRNQINVGFAAVILFIVTTVILMLHFIIGASYRDQEGQILQAHGQQIAFNIDSRIEYLISYLRFLSADAELIAAMERESFQYVRALLDNTTSDFLSIRRGRIRDILLHRNQVHQGIDLLENIDDIFFAFSPGNQAHRRNFYITATFLNDRNEMVFSIFKKVYQPNLERRYFLEMRIYETELFSFFHEDDSGNQIYILNNGYVMSMNDRRRFRSLLRQNTFVEMTPNSTNTMWIYSAGSGFDVIIELYPGFLNRGYFRLLASLIPLIITVLIVSFIFAAVVSVRFNSRLKMLQEKIAAISNWELNHELLVKGSDEFGMLADELDHTRRRILDLIGQNNYANEQKRKAEISALRSQINSHFLFNSLSSIKWLSKQDDDNILCDALDQLALFLRYSLVFDENQVSLHKEIEQLEAYIYLCKLRYGNDLHILVDIDKALMDCKCVKLILQPLVENSIYHGKGENALCIAIYSHIGEDYYHLIVEDDGLGISPEAIEMIYNNDKPLTQLGLGLRNVLERVKICSNGLGKVNIESEKGSYTKVIICQPMDQVLQNQ